MILGEQYLKMSNAIFCYKLTPIQLAVYGYLVCYTGREERASEAPKDDYP